MLFSIFSRSDIYISYDIFVQQNVQGDAVSSFCPQFLFGLEMIQRHNFTNG